MRFTEQDTKHWQKMTDELLEEVRQQKAHVSRIDRLREVLRFHEYRYYVLDNPLITDFEYDQLYKQLEAWEQKDPSRVTADSPTQRVAHGLSAAFPSVSHLVPMLSLENSYDANDLRAWDKRNREAIGEAHFKQTGHRGADIEYCVEPKFDGASISLVYENNLFTRGATRGDGVMGDDITTNLKQIRSIPLSADFASFGIQQVEIRGEVMLTKEKFRQYNEQLTSQGLAPLANPRNAAAGSLRIKDPREVGRRNLEAFLYHISYVSGTSNSPSRIPEELDTHVHSVRMLEQLGFRTPAHELKVLRGIDQVIDYCEEFEKRRDDLPYEIDGMVIKVNDTALQDRLGMTTHHPRWAMAFKFKARQATSKLRKVEFQVGRTGSITPVAKIDPVPIGGVTVSSISLFNEDVVREKDLKLGDTVLVERAGDVIPYIVKPLTELRTGHEHVIHFPHECPVCGEPLFKPEGEAVLRCVNVNCPAQVVERIIHFTSKDAMDIRGLGESTVRRFYEKGWITDIPSLYRLPFDHIRKLEGFGSKSVENLEKALEASRKQPLHRLIFALGIRYVGETTAKTLAQAIPYLPDLKDYSVERLRELEDVGEKVAASIHEFFHTPKNIQMLEALEALGLNLHSEKKKSAESGGSLAGLTFLFTGTLSKMKRSEAEALVEERGGQVLGGVSSKLNVLVVGEDAGSKLEKAKKIPSIRILSEDDFLQMVQN